jgi:hypothetical protein
MHPPYAMPYLACVNGSPLYAGGSNCILKAFVTRQQNWHVERRNPGVEWAEYLRPSSRIIQTPPLRDTKPHGSFAAGTNQILNIQGVRVRTDFIRFRTGPSGELL